MPIDDERQPPILPWARVSTRCSRSFPKPRT